VATVDGTQTSWERAATTSLTSLLEVVQGAQRGSCVWRKGEVDQAAPEALEAAAWTVAETGVRARCAGAVASFSAWRRRATGGAVLSPNERAALVAFVSAGFGVPEAQRSADHVEGHVAELVWFLLTQEEHRDDRDLRHIERPSFYVTSPGGDGLAVYDEPGALTFRLWEIKKHTGSSHLSSTTARAYKQLADHAPRYLAQYTSTGAGHQGDLGKLYAELVQLWLDAAPQAGAGVAVATSKSHSPRRCFSTMGQHLPHFDDPGRLEGLVTAIGDFSDFTRQVRDVVWTGLST